MPITVNIFAECIARDNNAVLNIVHYTCCQYSLHIITNMFPALYCMCVCVLQTLLVLYRPAPTEPQDCIIQVNVSALK